MNLFLFEWNAHENSIDLCLCKCMYTPRMKKEQKLQRTSCYSSKWFLCTISMLIIRPGIIMSFRWLDIHVHHKIKMSEPFLFTRNLRMQDSTNISRPWMIKILKKILSINHIKFSMHCIFKQF